MWIYLAMALAMLAFIGFAASGVSAVAARVAVP
jgi:hypothetical protein